MSMRHPRRSLLSLGALVLAAPPLAVMACATGTEPDALERSTEAAPPALVEHAAPRPGLGFEAMLEQRYAQRVAEAGASEIRGRVVNLAGEPLADVTVSAGGKMTRTNKRGDFTLTDLSFDVHVVSFDHPDHVFTQHVVAARYENEPYVEASLLPLLPARTFNADELTQIEQGPLTLTFEPGDLMLADTQAPVHGDVKIVATFLEPGRPGHIEAAPARLEGITEDGQATALDSFGMFGVELEQNGRRVQVRPGQTVGVRMQIPGIAGVGEGAAIPMWHHDTRLGVWVQEPGLVADVREQDGALVATTDVPHFSWWNLDGPKQSLCVTTLFPGATGFRAVSTDLLGSPDGYWTLTGECQGRGCVANAPSGWTTQENVAFKFQVQVAASSGGSQWCDVILVMNRAISTVLYGDTLEAYSKSLNASAPDSSFCGTYNAISGDIVATGAFSDWRNNNKFDVPLTAYDPDGDGDLIEHLVCPGTPSGRPADPGLGRMSSNALSSSYYLDSDRDGVNDTGDTCPLSSNNGACAANCYVAPGPNASWYDYDGDTVDDFCDSQWTAYNPSQYNGL